MLVFRHNGTFENRVVRPPDISVGGFMFYHGFFLSSFFSPPNLRARAERNSTKIVHIIGSYCDLKTRVQNLGHPRTNRGPQNHLFGRLRNLPSTLRACIFGTKHDIDNRISALTTTRGLLHRPKMSWTPVNKRLKTRPTFYPSSVNSTFCFIATLHRHRSANRECVCVGF